MMIESVLENKMVKKIGIGLVILLLLIAGGVYYVFSNLNELVRTAVEEAGSRSTSVAVTLGEVDINISEASASMGNLNVANPAGFQTDYAFNLGAIKVSIDSDSIGQNPIIVKEVVVTSPKVIYEVGDGLSNIETIQANVDRFIKDTVGESSGGGESSSGGDEQKVVINDLYIRGAEVSVSAPFLGGEPLGTTVPDIHLSDIGKDEGGADPAEVASQVIDQLLAGVTGAVGKLNLDDLAKGATEALQGAAEEAAGAVEGISEGAGGAVEDATEGVGDTINNLFGN